MEYLVLARKWRPQSFEDLVGQEHVVRTMKNAIAQGRIAHALIFSGPRGIGKTSVARIMAKAVNCETGPTATPCNACHNCREITDGISIDVREIDGASNRGIDEIRELREKIKFAPVSSRYKIYIIDEVHMLTREAFNALLKTLEEPPAHVIFIFATTEIQKVPATILSRCQRYDFRRVSLKQVTGNLGRIAGAEGIRISDKGLKWIAEAADGSMRDAQSIFDQVISYAGYDIADQDIEELLGLSDRRFLLSLSRAIFERNAGACLKIIDEGYYAGLDMKYFYQMLLGHFRDLLVAGIVGSDSAIFGLAKEEMDVLLGHAEGMSRETLQRLVDMLMADEENIKRTLNPRLTLETTVVRMAYLVPVIPIDKILARLDGLEKQLASGGISSKPTESASHRNQEGAPPEDALGASTEPFPARRERTAGGSYEIREGKNPDQVWEAFKAFIKGRNHLLWSKMEPGRLLAHEEDVLKIGFPRDYIFLDDINETAQKKQLAALAGAFFGEDLTVKIEAYDAVVQDKSNPAESGASGAANVRDIRREALHQPLLQKVLDVFSSAEVQEIIPSKNHKG